MASAFGSGNRRGGGAAGVFALLFAVLLVVTTGLGGYLVSRAYTQPQSAVFGSGADEADRVDITAWVTRVDPVAQKVSVTLTNIEPTGALVGEDGRFAVDVELETNSLRNVETTISAGEMLPNIEQEYSTVGVVTDFPFDLYSAYPSFRMTTRGGDEVPVTVTVESTDPFFTVKSSWDEDQSEWVTIDLAIERSYPTIVFGIFIMTLMLGLAVSAATLAFYVIRFKQGMQYSAYSVMAGLLFAMVPLRNAVPGNPPIGSVMDFMAFFIAEAVISVSLIVSVAMAYRHQRVIDDDRVTTP